CTGTFMAPDGANYLLRSCKKWSAGPAFAVARVSADGLVDGTLDQFTHNTDFGWRNAGTNTFYVFGAFNDFLGVNSRRIARVIPELTRHKASYDFDGDGKSDLAVFRPSNSVWYLHRSTAGDQYIQWGLPSDKIVAGDANRDGKTDIGVFRNGAWHAFTSSSNIHLYACLGTTGDKPFVQNNYRDMDVTGDVFTVRGPRTGGMRWLVGNTGYGNCWTNPSQFSFFVLADEVSTDKPVSGDFNGDSIPEVGYFRDGYWYAADSFLFQAPRAFQWGLAGDIPVPGDYDGDRQADYAVYRPSTGDWWINRSTEGVIAVRFGISTDIPVPADYDGDGKMDIAIYRDGLWWQYLSATGAVNVHQWGLAGDIPIPAQNQY
ncbi:MAG TPA: VCBS repeat-containing protein, partial [Pyrinomonadaceae bacterium]|nr:VCBS repeat-containing protein [Pyrinomonadaceae bacterium]